MKTSAGAALLPTGKRAVLALIICMHMLALLIWARQQPRPLPLAEAPEAVAIMLRPPDVREPPALRAKPITRHELPPQPPFHLRFDTPPVPAPVAAPVAAPPAASEAPADAPAAPAAPAPVPSPLDTAHAPMTVQDAIREEKDAEGGFAASLAKRQARRIDRALRQGRSGVPDEPDTPIFRLRRGLEQAHIDKSMSVQRDVYTSPDGIVYYRFRQGNSVRCRRGGGARTLLEAMPEANAAMNVPCPREAEWTRD